jgi:DNA-binding transcriptional regulator LsrR (DeoR family)
MTTAEKRHLHSLEGRIARLEAELQATRREWAELVEETGQAAVARELGVSRQAIGDRLRRIRADREGRSGRR